MYKKTRWLQADYTLRMDSIKYVGWKNGKMEKWKDGELNFHYFNFSLSQSYEKICKNNKSGYN